MLGLGGMAPSTNRPQDASHRPEQGRWLCRVCEPNVADSGGQAGFYTHYNRQHLRPVEVAEVTACKGL